MFCPDFCIYFSASPYTYLNPFLFQWTIWCRDLYGTRKTPKYRNESYNSIINMEDYPSLISSFTTGLPTLGLCCFRKTLYLVTLTLNGYKWKTPLVFILLYTHCYAQNSLFRNPYLNTPQTQLWNTLLEFWHSSDTVQVFLSKICPLALR